MIPFPFNENRFSFFVTDCLLVGQLCTNLKSDRSLLSSLKVTKWSTSEIEDATLCNSCSLLIQVMTTGPLPAPSKCKSGPFNVPRVMNRLLIRQENHILILEKSIETFENIRISWTHKITFTLQHIRNDTFKCKTFLYLGWVEKNLSPPVSPNAFLPSLVF